VSSSSISRWPRSYYPRRLDAIRLMFRAFSPSSRRQAPEIRHGAQCVTQSLAVELFEGHDGKLAARIDRYEYVVIEIAGCSRFRGRTSMPGALSHLVFDAISSYRIVAILRACRNEQTSIPWNLSECDGSVQEQANYDEGHDERSNGPLPQMRLRRA